MIDPGGLPVAPMLVAIATATTTLGLRRWPRLQIATSVAGGVVYTATVGLLAWHVVLAPTAVGIIAYQLGGWPAPFGITLVADGLSAFMLTMVAIVGLAALVFSVRAIDPANQRVYYHPLFHFLLLGVSGAFLTGDLFNLFVWFEVMLMASFIYVAFYGDALHTRATLRYLVVNVVGSALMLVAIGGLYATTGTLNMADLAQRMADPAAADVHVGPVLGLSALLFVVFALKAGLVPFQFWVPATYRAAPLPITAVLAGATKKVGVYAILRLYFTVFAAADLAIAVPGGSAPPLAFYGPVFVLLATASIAVGGFGAISAATFEEMFAYSSIGQVGFIVIPLGLAATATSPGLRHLGVLAALVYALNHALAKGTLFLATGVIRDATGSSRLADLGGLASDNPLLGIGFFVAALSLVGIPPLSGFFGKLLVFDTAVQAGAAPVIAVLLGGSVLTIGYTTRAWTDGFWGRRAPAVDAAAYDRVQVAIVVALAAIVVMVGIGFEPIYRFADAAATAALDTDGYVDAVDPAPPGGADP